MAQDGVSDCRFVGLGSQAGLTSPGSGRVPGFIETDPRFYQMMSGCGSRGYVPDIDYELIPIGRKYAHR
jgi:hypothetical protein